MEILIFPLLMFAAMWLLIIRPQRRRMMERERLLSALSPGQRIVTAGGLHGTIESIDDEVVSLEVADGVVLRVARRAVAEVHRDDLAATLDSRSDERTPDDESDDQ